MGRASIFVSIMLMVVLGLAAFAAVLSTTLNDKATEKAEKARCTPVYEQVYQPAIKLGGSGRLINVRDGENCAPD